MRASGVRSASGSHADDLWRTTLRLVHQRFSCDAARRRVAWGYMTIRISAKNKITWILTLVVAFGGTAAGSYWANAGALAHQYRETLSGAYAEFLRTTYHEQSLSVDPKAEESFHIACTRLLAFAPKAVLPAAASYMASVTCSIDHSNLAKDVAQPAQWDEMVRRLKVEFVHRSPTSESVSGTAASGVELELARLRKVVPPSATSDLSVINECMRISRRRLIEAMRVSIGLG